jgi:two-component sensor histidine kinase
VSAATAPYLGGGQDRIEISGDDVTVIPRVALTLAMVFHELTTNAVKYGALSAPSGRVEVAWRIVQAPSQPPLLWIEWRESGGPPVTTPTRRGFGSRFIEGSVASELQGAARLNFAAAGLRCTMEMPHDIAVPTAESE